MYANISDSKRRLGISNSSYDDLLTDLHKEAYRWIIANVGTELSLNTSTLSYVETEYACYLFRAQWIEMHGGDLAQVADLHKERALELLQAEKARVEIEDEDTKWYLEKIN